MNHTTDKLITVAADHAAPPAHIKTSVSLPDCPHYKYSFPYESKEELYTELPQPRIKWDDYYKQTIMDAAKEIRIDQLYVSKVKAKAVKIKNEDNTTCSEMEVNEVNA